LINFYLLKFTQFTIHNTQNLRKKLSSSLFVLHRIKSNISNATACQLYYPLISYHLTYCIFIWGNSLAQNLRPLYVLHNKFIKTSLSLPKRTPSVLLYKRTKFLTIYDLYKYHLAIIMYKVIHLPTSIPAPVLLLFHTLS
jgi:hypothetical protein